MNCHNEKLMAQPTNAESSREETLRSGDVVEMLEAELRSTIEDEHRYKIGSPSAMWTEGYKDGLRKAIATMRSLSSTVRTERPGP